jgi:hypothetical protein
MDQFDPNLFPRVNQLVTNYSSGLRVNRERSQPITSERLIIASLFDRLSAWAFNDTCTNYPTRRALICSFENTLYICENNQSLVHFQTSLWRSHPPSPESAPCLRDAHNDSARRVKIGKMWCSSVDARIIIICCLHPSAGAAAARWKRENNYFDDGDIQFPALSLV